MKRIYKCENGHQWLEPEDAPDRWRGKHECGGHISMAGWVKPEQESQIFHCSICGEMELPHWDKSLNRELVEYQWCFDCHFWMEKVEWRKAGNPKAFVIEGKHYMVEPEEPNSPKDFLGYGGSEFKIKAHDGREIVTHNLWHQGTVPERFRDVLVDNGVFVREGTRL